MNATPELPDVFSAAEIARVAGVRPEDVNDLAASGAGPARRRRDRRRVSRIADPSSSITACSAPAHEIP